MEHVAAAGVVGLHDLTAVAFAERLEQAARVATDPSRISCGTAVERDLHGAIRASTRFT
jgi:hypothetical protein